MVETIVNVYLVKEEKVYKKINSLAQIKALITTVDTKTFLMQLLILIVHKLWSTEIFLDFFLYRKKKMSSSFKLVGIFLGLFLNFLKNDLYM